VAEVRGQMNVVVKKSRQILKAVFWIFILAATIAVSSQEKANNVTAKDQPLPEPKASPSKKVDKMTYVLHGTEGYFELIVEDIIRGEVIKPWARIRNVGTTAVCIKEIKETVFGPPTDMKPFDASLEAGEETIYELDPINTESFLGDLCKTYSLKFDPPGKVEVTVYRSKEDLENDK
jgi:hypothetical protein